MIVALARKLAIALWRYVEIGLIPEGAVGPWPFNALPMLANSFVLGTWFASASNRSNNSSGISAIIFHRQRAVRGPQMAIR